MLAATSSGCRVVASGLLWWHLQQTLIEMTLGYLLGVGFGILAAFVVSIMPWGEPVARPVMLAAYATPKIALAPLIIIWFGIGLLPKGSLVACDNLFENAGGRHAWQIRAARGRR